MDSLICAPLQGSTGKPANINTCCEAQGSRMFGSLPEYIFTRVAAVGAAPPELFVNLFVSSTLNFNATVVEGRGEWPVVPYNATPLPGPPPMPLVPPPAPLRFVQLARGGYYPPTGDPHAPPLCGSCNKGDCPIPNPRCPGNVTSLEECKQHCVDSAHPQLCMGITWTPPSPSPTPWPPSPPACASDCVLAPIPTTAPKTGPFHNGVYNLSRVASISSLAACKAACLQARDCLQLTWMLRPKVPCVIYTAIYKATATITGAIGFVKCEHGSTSSACAHVSPQPVAPGNCKLMPAIDASVNMTKANGTEQWMITNRRNRVQHDWIASPPSPSPRPSLNRTATIQLTMNTDVPFASAVELTVGWANTAVHAVAMALHIRIPAWVASAPLIAVNGVAHGTGNPGTFFRLARTWRQGDIVALELKTEPRLVQYEGMDQIRGSEGKRYALKMGPIVLPAVGPLDKDSAIAVPQSAAVSPASWLKPIIGKRLEFAVRGLPPSTLVFKPFWAIGGNETFTAFPVFKTDDVVAVPRKVTRHIRVMT